VVELRSCALATIHFGRAVNSLIIKNGEYCLQQRQLIVVGDEYKGGCGDLERTMCERDVVSLRLKAQVVKNQPRR
jgi:hypothetical protein